MLKPHSIDFVKPYMKEPINCASDAVDFILKLYLDRSLWHFDDDPADFTCNVTSGPAFTESEIQHLRDRQVELFKYLKDPHELPLAIVTNANII